MTELRVVNSNDTALLEHLGRRERQCREERSAYARWLGVLTPLRWSMVGSSTALSAIAGAAILSRYEFFGARWDIVAAVCALTASLLSALHAAFNCDAYQEDCRRLVQGFYSLELAYQAAQTNGIASLATKAAELDTRFEEVIARASTSPPSWCRRK